MSFVEEPNPAELAVLRCLAAGLSRREIGTRLSISPHTVKTRTHDLVPQAGREFRADAIARAERLGLFERTESPG